MGKIFTFIASLMGYLLNFLYGIFNNYGVAIILFTIILKLLLLPISIKQHKTMKKSAKIQTQVKEIQEKYKNDPQRMNQETMDLYKRENMSPFSGCLSSIIQLIIVLSMFYLVSSPLTYMKKVDPSVIEGYKNELQAVTTESESSEGDGEQKQLRYHEIAIVKAYGDKDERVYLNMNFLGLDLSDVPYEHYTEWKVYIIPVLYVIMTIVSMKLMPKMTKPKEEKSSDDKETEIIEDNETKDLVKKEDEEKEADMMEEMSKNMNLMMPIMSVMIAMIAPLGLALYWLVSNIFSIIERLSLNKFIKEEGEEQNG